MDISGIDEYIRDRWIFQGQIDISGIDGYFRYRWIYQGQMDISGIDGYIRDRWIMDRWIYQGQMDISGIDGYIRYRWIYQVQMDRRKNQKYTDYKVSKRSLISVVFCNIILFLFQFTFLIDLKYVLKFIQRSRKILETFYHLKPNISI